MGTYFENRKNIKRHLLNLLKAYNWIISLNFICSITYLHVLTKKLGTWINKLRPESENNLEPELADNKKFIYNVL